MLQLTFDCNSSSIGVDNENSLDRFDSEKNALIVLLYLGSNRGFKKGVLRPSFPLKYPLIFESFSDMI